MEPGYWRPRLAHGDGNDRVASMEHLSTALGRGVPSLTAGLLGGMSLDQGDYCLDLLRGFCFSLGPRSTGSSCWLFCLPICFSGLSVDTRQRGSTADSASCPSWTCGLQAAVLFQPLVSPCACSISYSKNLIFLPLPKTKTSSQFTFLSKRIYTVNVEHINILERSLYFLFERVLIDSATFMPQPWLQPKIKMFLILKTLVLSKAENVRWRLFISGFVKNIHITTNVI